MKNLMVFETFVDDYYTEIKRLKKDAIDKLLYVGTTLIDDFGFDLYKKGFSFVNKKIINYYTNDIIEFSPELADELKRMKNRLKEYNMDLLIGVVVDDHDRTRIEYNYSDEFCKSLIGKRGNFYVFITK
jgi:hypothetical protein